MLAVDVKEREVEVELLAGLDGKSVGVITAALLAGGWNVKYTTDLSFFQEFFDDLVAQLDKKSCCVLYMRVTHDD